jgi:DNA-binding SARP family transcriptional activator
MGDTSIRLRLLGGIGLIIGQIPKRLATRKAELLLAYLVLAHPKEVSRERATVAIWPDVDGARARNNLSTTLWRIQKVLSGTDVRIVTRPGWLSIDLGSLEVDALQFKRLVESPAVDLDARVQEFEKATALYTGDLLEGVDEEWCEAERHHLRMMFVSCLKELVRLYRDRAAYDKATQVCRRIVALDPIDEETHRDLMLLYHLNGDRSAALAQYQIINSILQAELGISPEEKTTELWRYIRTRTAEVRPGRRTTYESGDTVNLLTKQPLVGREAELGKVVEGLTSALQGRGAMVILQGEAGVGKTKLVETAEVEARLRGFEVLKGRCTDLEDPAPYQAFIEALWPRISRKIQSDTPHVLADFLSHLSPAIRRGKKPSSSSGPATSLINEALLDLLDADTPTLLALEDFQHADSATKTIIQLLGGRLSARKMMVLLSVRMPFPKTGARARSVTCWAVEVWLEPLDRSQTDELSRLALGSRTIPKSALSIIWNMTAGNPLAVVEYLRFLVERGHLLRGTDGYWTWAESSDPPPQLPPRIQAVLRERIGALGSEERTLLLLAAVLGHDGDLQFLEQLSGLGPLRFADVMDQLFASGLLMETARGYRFAHESYRLATTSGISVASRRLLHERTASLMEQLWPARSEDLAWHFAEAGKSVKALTYAELSGDKARAVHANENALKWYSKALEFLQACSSAPEPNGRRISLLLKRQEVLELLGRCLHQVGDLDQIVEYATRQGDSHLLARCHCLRARSLGRMNKNTEALHAVATARRLYRMMNDSSGEARTHEIAAMVHINLRDARRVQLAYEKALSLFRSSHDRHGIARVAGGIGALMLFTGQSKAGLAYLERAEAILSRSSDKREYAPILIQKGVFWRCLGHADKSEQALRHGIEVMRNQGDRVGEARGLSQLAYTHMIMGMPRQALHEARQSIRLATEAGDTRGQIVFRNNAAYAVYRCLGEFNRAQRSVREALSLVSETARKENQAIYYDTMAAILYDKEDYEAAHHWATEGRKLYRRWSGQFDYVGAELDFHLGASALALGRTSEARECLNRAVDHWERSHDRAQMARGLALLGLTAAVEGNLTEANELAVRTDYLLRRTRGVEDVQCVYWAQAQVYHVSGKHQLSLRAIGRACAIIASQARMLKGRLRRSYLSIPTNKRIMKAAEAAGLEVPGLSLRVSVSAQTVVPEGHVLGREGVTIRRERLLRLIGEGSVRQHDLAVLLGVSERTVRSDIAALRNFGLLPQRAESLPTN